MIIWVIKLKIENLVLGRLRTNCYIVKKNNKCIIIDPGDEAEKIIEACKGYEVEEILVTHHHWDHILALKEIEEQYHLKHNVFLKKSFSYEIIKTPGHASDSFHTIGRCDLETSSIEDMKKSLEEIKKYPDDIKIYPGHGRGSVLGEEKVLFNRYF